MNVVRPSCLVPASSERLLACEMTEAYAAEQRVPDELQHLLQALEFRRDCVPTGASESPG